MAVAGLSSIPHVLGSPPGRVIASMLPINMFIQKQPALLFSLFFLCNLTINSAKAWVTQLQRNHLKFDG